VYSAQNECLLAAIFKYLPMYRVCVVEDTKTIHCWFKSLSGYPLTLWLIYESPPGCS